MSASSPKTGPLETEQEDNDRRALEPLKYNIRRRSSRVQFEKEGSEKSFSSSISSLGCQGLHDSPIELRKPQDGDETQDTTIDGVDTEDEVAMMMSKMISSKSGNTEDNTLGLSLVKRAAIIESIKWLGRHVPGCALDQLSQHVDNLSKKSYGNKRMELPHASEYQAALLFIDMSGFTKLSQHLDVESLSKVSNCCRSY